MDNNVILAISKQFAQDSAVLRFDYRGVGQSRIRLPDGVSVFDYWDDVETTKDYSDATQDVCSASKTLQGCVDSSGIVMVLGGYSFGAAVALKYGIDAGCGDVFIGIAPPLGKINFDFLSRCQKPCLLLLGKEDFLYSADKVDTLRAVVSTNVTIEVIEGCDHFFRGDEETIAQMARNFVLKHRINMETT
jgi:alpha/beta superfamily hydrolase